MKKRSWFVKPEEVKIDLSDGQWIKVKKRLTVAEERAMLTAGFRGIHREEDAKGVDVSVDWTDTELARVRTYLTDWSLSEEQGDKVVSVPLTYDSIKSLDPDAFDEIRKAIDKHVETVEEEKKRTTGEAKLKAI